MTAHVFPPALAPVLHARLRSGPLAEIGEEQLAHLLTIVFFAAMETYEGERNPIRVVFVGTSDADLVMPKGAETEAVPAYRWKILRFDSPRPFTIPELVKLAVAGADRRMYSAVRVERSTLVIGGLAREGFNAEGDPFVKIIASRPGTLSIRTGRDRLVDYERGVILQGGEDVVRSAKPVRGALEAAARAAGIEDRVVADYLDAVRGLVDKMAAQGHGGILVVSPEEHPRAAETATYKMVRDSSLAALLRLSQRVGGTGADASGGRPEHAEFGFLLHSAFVAEAEHVIEELGALTGVDGATVLNRDLALVAFGVILPVAQHISVAEVAGGQPRAIDLGHRGTRHRAGATYAADHPGSVVFVASEDGQVTCMLRDPIEERVLLWRLGPGVGR